MSAKKATLKDGRNLTGRVLIQTSVQFTNCTLELIYKLYFNLYFLIFLEILYTLAWSQSEYDSRERYIFIFRSVKKGEREGN